MCLLGLLTAPRGAAVVIKEKTVTTQRGRGLAVIPFGYVAYVETSGTSVNVVGDASSANFALAVSGATEIVAVAAGVDGNLWLADKGGNKIIYLSDVIEGGGTAHPYSPTAGSQPYDLVIGPDGNIWFTEFAGNRIGRITPAGVITEFSTGLTAGSQPTGICAGSDGNLWFVEQAGNKLASITTAGAITEYPMKTAGAFPTSVACGTDKIVFTEPGIHKIGIFYMYSHSMGDEKDLTPSANPQQITLGHDGYTFWFTEFTANQIGRLDIQETITEFPVLTPSAGVRAITAGRRGDIWFTQVNAGKLGVAYLSYPGDVNGDGNVNAADIFYLINFLFVGGPALK